MARILITGGSGMIGSKLTAMLLMRGHDIVHLGRSQKSPTIRTFIWDIGKGHIDDGVLEGVDAIVHLAGAGIGDGRWTERRKNEILKSRVDSTKLLHRELAKGNHSVRTFICASAVGYYGSDCGNVTKGEGDVPGIDFLANVCKVWEQTTEDITTLGIRVVRLRTGILLSPRGGALEPMARQVRFGLGAALGDGKQYMSWIHLDDHCEAIIFALEHDGMHGPYNSVAPAPVTNSEFTKTLARVLKRPFFLPNVPAFILKLLLGEMSILVLGGCKVSSEKLIAAGFKFKYPELDISLKDILIADGINAVVR
jgi:uncharacterized protein (TIGR01777 family)